jgi:O-antigen ligase
MIQLALRLLILAVVVDLRVLAALLRVAALAVLLAAVLLAAVTIQFSRRSRDDSSSRKLLPQVRATWRMD